MTPAAPSREDILRRIAPIRWWHRIDIHGIVTPGSQTPVAQRWISDAIDRDLTGLDVLDIGAWDGYYSFLAEARGAQRVVAVDGCQYPTTPEGFLTARELLGSSAEHHVLDVMDLDRLVGSFDRVFFFGVYYHLHNPIRALELIYQKLRPGGMLLLEGLVRAGRRPYLYAYRPEDLEPQTYCAATVPWLILTLERAGFRPVEFLSRFPGDSFWERSIRSLAWKLGLHWGHLKKSHRALIRAVRPRGPAA
jgi:tRNA (mo5U34)-methyltransferase